MKIVEKIKIKNGTKELDIFDDIPLQVVPIKYQRKYSQVSLNDYTYAKDLKTWNPQTLSFKFNGMDQKTFDKLCELLNEEDTTFELTITYGSKDYTTYVVVSDNTLDLIRNSGALNKLDYEFMQLSPFFVISIHSYSIEHKIEGQSTYPYTYPFVYGLSSNSYIYGKLNVFNAGDGEAPLKIEIFDVSNKPIVTIGNGKNDNKNNWQCTFSSGLSEVLVNNSFFPFKEISHYKADGLRTDISQHREFVESRGYLRCSKGNNTIHFNNVHKARITVYEKYFNLR